MKTIAIVSLVAALGLIFTIYTGEVTVSDAQFEEFIATYGRNYASEGEMDYRREIFKMNMIKADELNRINPYAEFGMTKFSDLTEEEMIRRMGAVDPKTSDEGKSWHTTETDSFESIDFTDKMQAVQNQGSCGSCWAFSATAAFEARQVLSGADSSAYKASEQEALDCSSPQYGCNGGWYEAVWELVESNNFCTLDSYGYTARKTECLKSSCKGGVRDTGYKLITKSESAMYDALTSGPISIAVDASTWSSYRGGVVTRATCGTGMNHAVVIVAYDSAEDAWKVRNSWGADWGENGYIRLKQGENTCNLLYKPAYPTF